MNSSPVRGTGRGPPVKFPYLRSRDEVGKTIAQAGIATGVPCDRSARTGSEPARDRWSAIYV